MGDKKLEYRKRKNVKYLKEEVNKPKIIRKEIKRAVPKSYAQRLF